MEHCLLSLRLFVLRFLNFLCLFVSYSSFDLLTFMGEASLDCLGFSACCFYLTSGKTEARGHSRLGTGPRRAEKCGSQPSIAASRPQLGGGRELCGETEALEQKGCSQPACTERPRVGGCGQGGERAGEAPVLCQDNGPGQPLWCAGPRRAGRGSPAPAPAPGIVCAVLTPDNP